MQRECCHRSHFSHWIMRPASFLFPQGQRILSSTSSSEELSSSKLSSASASISSFMWKSPFPSIVGVVVVVVVVVVVGAFPFSKTSSVSFLDSKVLLVVVMAKNKLLFAKNSHTNARVRPIPNEKRKEKVTTPEFSAYEQETKNASVWKKKNPLQQERKTPIPKKEESFQERLC